MIKPYITIVLPYNILLQQKVRYYRKKVSFLETNYKDRYIKMGLKIQYYRKLKGYTQEVFAEKIDMSWSFVAQVESRAMVCGVSLETLFKMADVLEIEPYKLIKDDD